MAQSNTSKHERRLKVLKSHGHSWKANIKPINMLETVVVVQKYFGWSSLRLIRALIKRKLNWIDILARNAMTSFNVHFQIFFSEVIALFLYH